MADRWHEIWNRRSANEGAALDLADLIALDGFDSGAGKIGIGDWREYARRVSGKIGLKGGNSVYEVGCGCGAFLYALREHVDIRVGGNDYGAGLIDTARKVFPESDFQCVEAAQIDTSGKYDYVIANSVFHYFHLDYALQVLTKMLDKATLAVCILDIPDLQTKEAAEALRRDILSPEEYEKKYAGLNHTYYTRGGLAAMCTELGCTCETFDGCVPNYEQSQFRFGCLIKK